MRSRFTQVAVLLLLLSSLAVSDARAVNVERSRTPGGVFVRNLLLQAAVEEAEPDACGFESGASVAVAPVSQEERRDVRRVAGPVEQTAHVHAVTGSSL